MNGRTARAGAALAAVRWLGVRRPVVVSWAVTHRCQLACGYCDIPRRALPELSPAEALATVDAMAAAGTRALSFNGGEPLLRDDIAALAARARGLGMAVSLTTNGALLPAQGAWIDGLDALQLSVDGPPAVHEANRGPHSWEAARAGLDVLARFPAKRVISAVLTRHNVAHVDALVAIARDHGAWLSVLPVGPVHAFDGRHRSLAPAPEAMRAALRELERRARAGAPVLGSPSSFAYLASWPHAPAVRCVAGRGLAKLAADGRVYPCAVLEHRTDARSVRDVGFARAFAHAGAQPLRCDGCHCTKTLQLNRLLHDPLGAVPFRYRRPGRRSSRSPR